MVWISQMFFGPPGPA
ncbi:MAG: hypothetical protein ACYC58_12225 [Pseudomonadaceae bacterium]